MMSFLGRGHEYEAAKEKKFPTLKGHPAAQQHAKEAIESYYDVKDKVELGGLMKEFKIYRWNPHHHHHLPTNKPFLQSFFVDLSTCGPMVIKFPLFFFFKKKLFLITFSIHI